jgi:hypothetical protein
MPETIRLEIQLTRILIKNLAKAISDGSWPESQSIITIVNPSAEVRDGHLFELFTLMESPFMGSWRTAVESAKQSAGPAKEAV